MANPHIITRSVSVAVLGVVAAIVLVMAFAPPAPLFAG